MAGVSDLPREARCNSWVVIRLETGLPVLETFSEAVAAGVSRARFEVVTTAEWLRRFNRRLAQLEA